MRLWNDYEGLTVEEASPGPVIIDKLLRPEGRSAFFTARNGSGKPAVLRLIESIHDDAEILDRWRTVASLGQPNLVGLKQFGQTVLEGEPLLYAVLEPTEISLEEILRERPLTPDETRDLATSLTAALQALHGAGLVHEHVDVASVLATADAIKLRSDCIRSIPSHLPPTEAQAPVVRDVHDLSVVLLRALTLKDSLAGLERGYRLPAPFDQIIPNGLSGTWGLEQIAASLAPAPVPTTTPAAVTDQPVMATPPQVAVPTPILSETPIAPASVAASAPSEPVLRPVPPSVSQAAVKPAASNLLDDLDDSRDLSPVGDLMRSRYFWVAAAAGVLVLLSILWYGRQSPSAAGTPAASAKPASAAAVAGASKPSAAITTQSHATPQRSTTAQPARSVPAARSPEPVAASSAAAHQASGPQQWRVVAFTYNRQDQAQHKVEQIAREHPRLSPQVFTLSGGAPYLVTLGGSMSREQAFALRDRARAEGLPRDIYAQNYNAR